MYGLAAGGAHLDDGLTYRFLLRPEALSMTARS